MIVLETSSYEELVEHLKISVLEFYRETESPVNSSNFHPFQESQRTTLCLYVCMGKEGEACADTEKNFLFAFNSYLSCDILSVGSF